MGSVVAVLVLLVAMLSGRAAMAQSCTSAIVSLAPCLSYISGSSSTPSSSCCLQLSSVVQSQARCLCQVLNGGGSSFGVSINQTQALALPAACKVQTPPVSQCNAANEPAGSPAKSPVGSPTNSPADASTPEGSITPDDPAPPTTISSIPSTGTAGSKSTTSNTSDANLLTKFSLDVTLLVLIIASSVFATITN